MREDAKRRISRFALRSLAICALVLVGLVVVQLLRHDERRADLRVLAAKSPATAAGMIAQNFGAASAICHPVGFRDDIENLISALFALERFAMSPFERRVESLLARFGPRLGFAPPDLSYGPGQIRLSRAVSLMGHDTVPMGRLSGSTLVTENGATTPGHVKMARVLMEPCGARGVARRLILSALLDCCAHDSTGPRLERADIMRVAAVYNAQAAPGNRTTKAALAHRLFNEVTYHLTVYYRYQ